MEKLYSDNKISYFNTICIMIIMLLAIANNLKAQAPGNTCVNSIPIGGGDTCLNNQQVTGSEVWYSLTADSANISIALYNSPDTSEGHFHTIAFYEGNCNGLNLKASKTLVNANDTFLLLIGTNLIVGNTYYVQLTRTIPNCSKCSANSGHYDLCFEPFEPQSCLLKMLCPGDICFGEPANFINQSFCNLVVPCGPNPEDGSCFDYYLWDFGDGSPKVFVNVASPQTHIYTAPGTYTVTLHQANAQGGIHNANNFVTCIVVVREALQISFNASPNPACYGDNICFNISGNAFPTDPHNWDFGDISFSNNPNPCHTYSLPGIYTVTLTVTNVCGTETYSQIITVNSPKAYFTATSACPGEEITFTDLSDCNPNIVSWFWNFGDNTTSTSQNPIHIYANSGAYNVTLTVTDTHGSTSQITLTTVVYPLPTPAVTTGVNNTCDMGHTQTYCAQTGYSAYNWYFDQLGPIVVSGQGTNCFEIDFNGFESILLHLTVTNEFGCFITTDFQIFKCCEPDPLRPAIHIDNMTAGSYINTYFSNVIPYPNAANPKFVINGTFTVDQNMSIQFLPELYLGPDAKIDILPGNTLTIISKAGKETVLQAGCDYMWDGIYINGPTAHLDVFNSPSNLLTETTLQDAKNAIVSLNGGDYQLLKLKLNKNFKGMVVGPYGGVHTGRITNSLICCFNPANQPANVLIAPYAGRRTSVGIEINGVNTINIGDPSAGPVVFNYMDQGIFMKNSSANIKHNTFKNIYEQFCVAAFPNVCPLTGVAIYDIGTPLRPPFAPTFNLVVGGTAVNDKNIFYNCSEGVRVENNTNVRVENNEFTMKLPGNPFNPSRARCISVENCQNRTIFVKGNQLLKYKTGIQTRFTFFSNVDILNNNLPNNNLATPGSRGIVVQDAAFTAAPGIKIPQVNIINNNIDKTQTGILGMLVSYIYAYNNIITLPNTLPSGTTYGMRFNQCFNSTADLNTISRNPVPQPSHITSLYGISSELSPGIIITSNLLTNMGSGIRCFGTMPNSTLRCNVMTQCQNGVREDASIIGQQGGPGIPSDNQWYQRIGTETDIVGVGNFIAPNWYFRNGFAFVPDFIVGTILPKLTSGPNNCPVAPCPPPCNGLVAALADIVNNQVQYQGNLYENNFFSKHYVYKELLADSSLMYQNVPMDTVFRLFRDSVALTDMGMLETFEEYIGNYDVTQAQNVNASVSGIDVFEYNQKQVNEIYLSTFAQGNFILDSMQRVNLEAYAVQNPLYAGKGVYTARVMLDINPDDNIAGNQNARMRNENEELPARIWEEAANDFKIVPNPNDGNMLLEYSLKQDEAGTLSIFDISGRRISFYPLFANENRVKVSEEILQNGIYFYTVSVNEQLVKKGKLIIIR